MQFESSFVTQVLLYLDGKGGAKASDGHVRMSELSHYLGIPQQDVRLICNIIRRMHLLNVKVMPDNDNEYWLTTVGKERLSELQDARRKRGGGQSSRTGRA